MIDQNFRKLHEIYISSAFGLDQEQKKYLPPSNKITATSSVNWLNANRFRSFVAKIQTVLQDIHI